MTVVLASRYPAAPTSGDATGSNLLSCWLGFPCFLYGLMSLSLRELGELPLLFAVFSAVLALAIAGQWPLRGRYMPFFLFSLTIMILSLAQFTPRSWTRFYDESAAMRQWFYVPVLPILVAYFMLALRTSYGFLERNAFVLFAVAAFMSRLSQNLHGAFDPETDVFFYTFTNDVAIVALIYIVFIFRTRRALTKDISLIALALLMSSSAQSQLVWLFVLGLRLSRRPILLLAGIATVCLSFIAIAPFFAVPLHGVDHNTSVRAILWRDVLLALVDTLGAGVGYGTEYIKHRFDEIMPWGWTIGTGPTDMFVATHSSFYDVLLREGVIGLAFFSYWFFYAVRISPQADLHGRRLASSVAALLVVNSAVNVGLSSVSFLFGSAFAVALLGVLRERAQIGTGSPGQGADGSPQHPEGATSTTPTKGEYND